MRNISFVMPLVAIMTLTFAVPSSAAVLPDPRCVILTKPLSIGSTNGTAAGQVTLVQDFLARYEYPVSVTGYFGSQTASALRAFQADHGLPITGTVNGTTQSYVHALTCGLNSPPAGGPAALCAASQTFCPKRSFAARINVPALSEVAFFSQGGGY